MTHDQTIYEISVSNFNAYFQISTFSENPPLFPLINIQVINKAKQGQLKDTSLLFLLPEYRENSNKKFRFIS